MRLQQCEFASGEPGGRALARRRCQRALLADLRQQPRRDGVCGVERQRGAKGIDGLVELPLLEPAASQSRPRGLARGIEADDRRVDGDRFIAEV
jgi:hypothetical protein